MTNCRLEIAEANCRSLTPIRKGGGWVRDDNGRWGAAANKKIANDGNDKLQIGDCRSELQIPHPHPQGRRLGSG